MSNAKRAALRGRRFLYEELDGVDEGSAWQWLGHSHAGAAAVVHVMIERKAVLSVLLVDQGEKSRQAAISSSKQTLSLFFDMPMRNCKGGRRDLP